VQPALPRLRLWPESVAGLFGAPDALPRLTPNWDKRYLDATPPADPQAPLPLHAIYLLSGPGAGAGPSAWIAPREALVALLGTTSAAYVLDAALRAGEFRTLDRLVQLVPPRRLAVPDGFVGHAALCDAIIDEVRAGVRSAGAAPPEWRGSG
jgi:hypothetical protein